MFSEINFGRKWCLLAVLMVFVPVQGQASLQALDFSGVIGGFGDNNQRVIGWEFTVGDAPIWVTSLSVYDHDIDGLASDHEVGIYEEITGDLVVSATISGGFAGVFTDLFLGVPVSSTMLAANTEYVIAATWPGTGNAAHGFGDQWVWDPTFFNVGVENLVIDPAITIGDRARFVSTSAELQYPTEAEVGGRSLFIGPNFGFSLVPEPASAALLALAAPLFLRRRA